MNTTKLTDYTPELNKVLQALQDMPFDPSLAEHYWDVCCGCVLVAEYNNKERTREWQIAGLCNTLLHYIDYTFQCLPHAYPMHEATGRMCQQLYEHPRLQLQLYQTHLALLQHNNNTHEQEIKEWNKKIALYKHNIACADAGKYEDIISTGHLKHDPVEWTALWEKVIDQADELTYNELADIPKAMGFCHMFWSTRRHILYTRFQLEWRSPAAMNPKVLFD